MLGSIYEFNNIKTNEFPLLGKVAEAFYLDRPETKILTQRALSRLPEDLAKTVKRFALGSIPNI